MGSLFLSAFIHLFIYSFKYYSFNLLPPCFPLTLVTAYSSRGVCSIRNTAEWVNPRGVSRSYGHPQGQGDLRGSSPQRTWRRKERLQGEMVEERPSRGCVCGLEQGWGGGDKGLKRARGRKWREGRKGISWEWKT